MGFGSPVHDVKGHSASRPPLVLFVICLVLFSCATLAMAFYTEYADLVLNPEIKVGWKKLLSNLDSLDLCTHVEGRVSEESVSSLYEFFDSTVYNVSRTDDRTASITVAANLFLSREFRKFPAGMIALTGTVHIEGASELFHIYSDATSSINLTLFVPQNLTETKYKDTCVILTGPRWLLPLSRRSNVCVPSSMNKTITHVGSLISTASNDTSSCRNGSAIKLSYSSQSDDDFYLSKEEKLVIYSHLVRVSFFLFVASLVFLCCIVIRGRARPSVVDLDKIPLTL